MNKKNFLLLGNKERCALLKDAIEETGGAVVEYDEDSLTQAASRADILVYAAPTAEALPEDYAKDKGLAHAAELYDMVTLLFLRYINLLLPYLKEKTRIGIWNISDSSVGQCQAVDHMGLHMSAAALNMAAKQLFPNLRARNMTMRISAATDVRYAINEFVQDRSIEPHNLPHSDENRIAMRGDRSIEIPW